MALFTISIPVVSSSFAPFKPSNAGIQRMYATPPPGTMPSAIAALVALNASSTRSFFSFISTSEAAPI